MSMLEARHFIGANLALPEPICPRLYAAHFIRTRAFLDAATGLAAFGWWANRHAAGRAAKKFAVPTIAARSYLSTPANGARNKALPSHAC